MAKITYIEHDGTEHVVDVTRTAPPGRIVVFDNAIMRSCPDATGTHATSASPVTIAVRTNPMPLHARMDASVMTYLPLGLKRPWAPARTGRSSVRCDGQRSGFPRRRREGRATAVCGGRRHRQMSGVTTNVVLAGSHGQGCSDGRRIRAITTSEPRRGRSGCRTH